VLVLHKEPVLHVLWIIRIDPYPVLPDLLDQYFTIDVNIFQEHIFHTKCKLKNFDLDNYFFNFSVDDLSPDELNMIITKVRKEMDEVFYGRNLPD